MKKFLYTMLAFMFVLPLALGLVACDKEEAATPQLTKANFVGEWYVYSEDYTYDTTHEVYTYARLKELHDAGETASENDEYADLETYIYMFQLRNDGRIQWKDYYADETEYDENTDAGTWGIENNQFWANVDTFYAGNKTVEYKNGDIVITRTRMWQEKLETSIITFKKVA